MHVLETLLGPITFSSVADGLSGHLSLLGYVGLGPGAELIPYFLALLSFIGVALLAVVQWPLAILFGYVSKWRRRGGSSPTPSDALPNAQDEPAPAPHSSH